MFRIFLVFLVCCASAANAAIVKKELGWQGCIQAEVKKRLAATAYADVELSVPTYSSWSGRYYFTGTSAAAGGAISGSLYAQLNLHANKAQDIRCQMDTKRGLSSWSDNRAFVLVDANGHTLAQTLLGSYVASAEGEEACIRAEVSRILASTEHRDLEISGVSYSTLGNYYSYVASDLSDGKTYTGSLYARFLYPSGYIQCKLDREPTSGVSVRHLAFELIDENGKALEYSTVAGRSKRFKAFDTGINL